MTGILIRGRRGGFRLIHRGKNALGKRRQRSELCWHRQRNIWGHQKLGRFFPRTFRHLWESISLVVIYSFVAICYGNPKETNISMTFHKFTIKNCLRFIFSSILLLFPTVGSREVGTKHGWKKVTSYADWIRLNSGSARSDKPLAGSAMYSISLINSYKITFTFPKG